LGVRKRIFEPWQLEPSASPVKQAVISPSAALSLMYPAGGIRAYPREEFITDLLREHETEVRRCLLKGAHCVQIDFTEGRLAMKIDPSGHVLNSFIDLNNPALSRFSAEERRRRCWWSTTKPMRAIYSSGCARTAARRSTRLAPPARRSS
jgi:5-methyltetrahydropteroyltriglutamate--homocysteine methyltransferase